MRSFFAIELDDESRLLLTGIQNHLRQEGVTGNFSFPENLHLTIKFLGEIDNMQYSRAQSLLKIISQRYAPFVLSFHSLGKFEKRGKMIIWAGLKRSDRLYTLNRDVEAEWKEFMPGLTEVDYSPHITLAREAKSSRLFKDLDVLKEDLHHSFTAHGLSLMESTRVDGRLTYVRRAYQPFALKE